VKPIKRQAEVRWSKKSVTTARDIPDAPAP
jgi:hypothetical protein